MEIRKEAVCDLELDRDTDMQNHACLTDDRNEKKHKLNRNGDTRSHRLEAS
jgi:hypothetical protein